MQEIKINVATTKDFLFKPTEMTITIMGVQEAEGKKVFPVFTRLVQKTAIGEISETANLQFTKEQLESVLNGYDYELNTPTVNKEALSAILSSFNLEINEG